VRSAELVVAMRVGIEPARVPAEEAVEALIHGAAGGRAAEMPFAERRRVVAGFAQLAGEGGLAGAGTSQVGSEESAPLTPVRSGFLAVRIAAREAEQVGALEYHSVKRTPEAATRSRLGVRTSGWP